MSPDSLVFCSLLFLLIAVLYSSIGHAGASGYLAIMSLLSFTPNEIRPIALTLNIMVALIASVRFIRAGYFDRKIFFPAILCSLPMAYFGGSLEVNPSPFRWMAGSFLVLSALLLAGSHFIYYRNIKTRSTSVVVIAGAGAVIGFFSGIIGVGGGIFLSPILILAGWTAPRVASGIAALFILLNSLAAYAGQFNVSSSFDQRLLVWIPVVIAGGLLGSWLGASRLSRKVIIAVLSFVLFTAGFKFFL